MKKHHITLVMPTELWRITTLHGDFIWRHGESVSVERQGRDVVFILPDDHPEWSRLGMATFEEFTQKFPETSVTIVTPGLASICGRLVAP